MTYWRHDILHNDTLHADLAVAECYYAVSLCCVFVLSVVAPT